MEIINLNDFKNNGMNGPARSAFSKVNQNAVYNAAVIEATRSLCGFDRKNESTLGILQYCHDASSGIVDNISAARDHLFSALHEIECAGLPTNECRAIGSCIIHNESTGQIEKGANDEIWIDHRRGYPVARF